MDRLIRDALRSDTPADTGACLDAETLAAWADDVLDRRERARAEAHAAGCARCQALLAAMVRTEVDSSLPRRSAEGAKAGRSVGVLRWAVPLAAAAAVVVVWLAVPRPAPVAPAQREVDKLAASAPTRSTASAVSPPSAEPSSADAKALAKDTARPQAPPAERKDDRSAAVRQEAARDAAAKNPDERFREADQLKRDARAKEAQIPASPPAATPPPAALAEQVTVAPAERRAFADARGAAAADAFVVESAGGRPHWRIRGTTVERSLDGGASWQRQATPARAPLRAGSSPSPSVCWLVGANGTVLVTTDGVVWRGLTFPDASADLISVRATDDKTAIAQTADGRRFSTADGGSTWTQGPQGH